MKTASLTDTKNNLSAILQEVREGETYVILDRGKPVARLERVEADARGLDERCTDLERRGLIRRGRGKARKEILEVEPPRLPRGVSALAALLEERRDGR